MFYQRKDKHMKPSGIGGQAVIEGVMMKNKERYAIAVRKPDNEIIVKEDSFNSIADKYKVWKLPILRGVLAFAESMSIGIKTLNFSASFYEEEETAKESKVDKAISKVFKDKGEAILAAITMIIAVVLAVGIFIVLPAFAATQLGKVISSDSLVALVEGIIRIVIFVLYVVAISQLKDIKRVFMYHGAEHKTINCIENGIELTVENVKWQSRQHKRCGTSFLFIVMFVSVIFFMFIRTDITWLRYASRIILIPVIAGISYEFIRFAGRNDSIAVRVLSKPGMWLQGLTTREPDDDMIEVAIKSVEAVFNWKDFLGVEDSETGEVPTEEGKTAGNEKQSAVPEAKGKSNNRTKNTSSNKNTSKNTQNNSKSAQAKSVQKTGSNNKSNNSQNRDNKNIENKNLKSEDSIKSEKSNQKQADIQNQTDVQKQESTQKQNSAARNNKKSTSGKKDRANTARSNNQKKAEDNKAVRETAATSMRMEPLQARDIFEEEDEILRALDDFVAVTDEADKKD